MSQPWILDPEILAIKIREDPKRIEDHNEVLRELVKLIFAGISQTMNYDHVVTSIPRYEIPLEYRGKRYDISFVKDGRIFYVQLDSEPLNKDQRRGE